MIKKTEALRISQMLLPSEVVPETPPPKSDSTKFSPQRAESPPLEVPASIHHPQIVDQDVDDFSTRLNSLITHFRNESMKEFMTMKRNLLHEQIGSIEGERKRCNAQLSAKQDEVEHLKEDLSRTRALANTLDAHKEALSKHLQRKQGRRLELGTLKRAFGGWLNFHTDRRVEKKRGKLVNARGRTAFLQRVYQAWKEKWTVYHQKKQEERIAARVETEKTALSTYFNKEIQMLRARLEASETRLAQEEEAKATIQENLKKAFLRGVCAMNFEAMNLLNPGALLEENEEKEEEGFGMVREPRVFQSPGISTGSPAMAVQEFQEPRVEPHVSTLSEIQSLVPPESKDHRWKPAPVFGRPQTAPEMPTSLPSNLNQPQSTQGKTIIVNPHAETRVKGQLPQKTAVKRKN